MSVYIGDPPVKAVIPVTKGCSRSFTVQRVDAEGEPETWDATITLIIEIDRSSAPVRIEGVVNGSNAAIVIPSETCDRAKNSTVWQLLMKSVSTNLSVPVMVGKFERNDS